MVTVVPSVRGIFPVADCIELVHVGGDPCTVTKASMKQAVRQWQQALGVGTVHDSVLAGDNQACQSEIDASTGVRTRACASASVLPPFRPPAIPPQASPAICIQTDRPRC